MTQACTCTIQPGASHFYDTSCVNAREERDGNDDFQIYPCSCRCHRDIEARIYALKVWRQATAKAVQCPPFWIMSNQIMVAVAARNPQTLSEVQDLIGTTRGERYGHSILDVLRSVEVAA